MHREPAADMLADCFRQPTVWSRDSSGIARADFGSGLGRRGSRTPADPPPRPSQTVTDDPGALLAPAFGSWSMITAPDMANTNSDGPSGSEPIGPRRDRCRPYLA